jgi:hypothetical protein
MLVAEKRTCIELRLWLSLGALLEQEE